MEANLTGRNKILTQSREVISVVASHSATWNASRPEIYEYLSNLDNLLPVIPNLQRLQIARQSNMARLLMSVASMGQRLNIVIDLQTSYLPEQHKIILASIPLQTQLFGPSPAGYLPANFRTEITLGTGRNSGSLVMARLQLGLEELPPNWAFFANSFFGGIAKSIAYEQIQKVVAQLMACLENGFARRKL